MGYRYDAIVLMGPPGCGKSFIGNRLDAAGVASYLELEALLRQKFGVNREFKANLKEARKFVWRSYHDQLREFERAVALESAGWLDRPLLESLQAKYRVALVHVQAERSVCIDRVVSRAPEKNIINTLYRGEIGRAYDAWQDLMLPSCHFAHAVDGTQVEEAVESIRGLLSV